MMNSQTNQPGRSGRIRTPGEPFVWFTSMGLAMGLLMVVFLIALIVRNGIGVFWPDEVAVIQLRPGSNAGMNGSQTLAGRIVKKQEKIIQIVSKDEKGTDRMIKDVEWQLFLGNKDIYGLAFKFIDYKDIADMKYPKEIISIERLEYGDGIGYPRWLEVKGKGRIAADNSGFGVNLNKLVKESNDRWTEIRWIEKKKIGEINLEMEKLRLERKVIESKTKDSNDPRLQKIQDDRVKLQADYELLADRASKLRGRQDESILTYGLVTGEEKQLPISQIVSYYYPNQLSFWGRLRLFFQHVWGFLSDEPREANTEGGIFPAIFGTFVMTLLLSLAVTPFGVLAAIYLREYAKQGVFVRSVRIAVNNLAGVPSIVFGVFGLGFFVYLVGGTIDRLFFNAALPTPTFGTGGILWASLTLALMTVPVVIVATEEALSAVPRGMREGSLACGASKWQTIQRVVLPASSQGILTGLILAMARGAGEVAPLMLVGVVKLAPSLPLDTTYPFLHLNQKFMHLGFHIYDLGFQSPDSEAAKPMVFATTFLLILLVVVLNLGAIVIRERLRKKYATGAF
jgi:phosphate transport system permease protein